MGPRSDERGRELRLDMGRAASRPGGSGRQRAKRHAQANAQGGIFAKAPHHDLPRAGCAAGAPPPFNTGSLLLAGKGRGRSILPMNGTRISMWKK